MAGACTGCAGCLASLSDVEVAYGEGSCDGEC